MNKIAQPVTGIKIMTVGELISELCRQPDHATISIRCPLQDQRFSVFRIECRSPGMVEIELDPTPDCAPVVPT
jgi:hypothetical protein